MAIRAAAVMLVFVAMGGTGCSCEGKRTEPVVGPNVANGLRLMVSVEPGSEREPIRRRVVVVEFQNVRAEGAIHLDGRAVTVSPRIVDSGGAVVPVMPTPPYLNWSEQWRIVVAPGKSHRVRIELAAETVDKLDGPWYLVNCTYEVDEARLPPNLGLWTGRVTSNTIRLSR